MSPKFKSFLLNVAIITLLSLNINTAYSSAVQTDINSQSFVILFDEGHGQYFNRSRYSEAIASLESFQEVDFQVVYNTGELNKSLLEGIDILVVTNPNTTFTDAESYYLTEYLKKGKAAVLLANPLNESDNTINGRGDSLNYLIKNPYSDILDTNFWTYSGDIGTYKRTDIVKNDYDNEGVPFIMNIEVNSTDHEILSYYNNITEIVTYSSSIKAKETVISAEFEAYGEGPDGKLHDQSTRPKLIGVRTSATDGYKLIIGGSTIMFSDLNNSYIKSSSWFNAAQNKELWLNMFLWLVNYEKTTSATEETLTEMIVFISTLIVVGLILIGTGRLAYSVGINREIKIIKTGILAGENSVVETTPASIEKLPQTTKSSKRMRRLKQVKNSKKSGNKKQK